LIIRTPIEYCHPARSRRSNTLVFQNPESARSSRVPVAPARPARAISSSQNRPIPFWLLADPRAQADVQDLAGVGARGQDRVVAEQMRVAVGGALLEPAAHLADEAVDIDHQPAVAGPGPGHPRALERLCEQPVQLADMTEGERAQERAQRRRRRQPAAEQPVRTSRPEHVGVVDAVGAKHHRQQQRHHLAARVGGARPAAAQPHQPCRPRLDPEPLRERRNQRHAGIRDHPLIIEQDFHAVQSDWPVILHHEGDLLTRAPTAHTVVKKPCSGGHSSQSAGQNSTTASVDPG
jgi:hypothetical protein